MTPIRRATRALAVLVDPKIRAALQRAPATPAAPVALVKAVTPVAPVAPVKAVTQASLSRNTILLGTS